MNRRRSDSSRVDVAIEFDAVADPSNQTVKTDLRAESPDEDLKATQNSGTKIANDERSPDPRRPLAESFEPSDYSVIIGRGKKIREAPGNSRLRVLAGTYLTQYADAMDDRPQKTAIVNAIIGTVKAVCALDGGAFIRQDEGRWYEVSDRVAREKVGYVFRDLLHDKYGSSSQSKIAKRRRQKQQHSSSLNCFMHQDSLSMPSHQQTQHCQHESSKDHQQHTPQPHQWHQYQADQNIFQPMPMVQYYDSSSLRNHCSIQPLFEPIAPIQGFPKGVTGPSRNINFFANISSSTTVAGINSIRSPHSDASSLLSWKSYCTVNGGGGDEAFGVLASSRNGQCRTLSSALGEPRYQHNSEQQQQLMAPTDRSVLRSMSEVGTGNGFQSSKLSGLQWEILLHHRNRHVYLGNDEYSEEAAMIEALCPRPFPPTAALFATTVPTSTAGDPVSLNRRGETAQMESDRQAVHVESMMPYGLLHNSSNAMGVGNQFHRGINATQEQAARLNISGFGGSPDIGNVNDDDNDSVDLSQLLQFPFID